MTTIIRIIILFTATLLFSCSSTNEPLITTKSKSEPVNIEHEFNKALLSHYSGNAKDLEQFESIINKQKGSRYASYSYLLLGNSYFADSSFGNYEISGIYYRLFLETNKGNHLNPFVYAQLTNIAYTKNNDGFFVNNTDLEAYYDVMDLYYRFFLIYPKSIYLDELKQLVKKSEDEIVNIEESIGDWYFKKEYYVSAENRYRYILKNFSNNHKKDIILEKLKRSLEAGKKDAQLAVLNEIASENN